MRISRPDPPGPATAASRRRWLLPLGGLAGLLTLLALSRGAPPGMRLSYSRFVADVGAGTVSAVTIGPAGQVTGSLTDGRPFTTTIPVALDDRSLAGLLAAHHVQVTATTAMPSSLLSVLTGLLPLLLIGGLLYIGIRSARRQAVSLGGAAGLTRAKARVIDAERPATQFADVAGYPAVKTEISEVVDYLRDPGRYHRAGARGPRGVLMAGPPGTKEPLPSSPLPCSSRNPSPATRYAPSSTPPPPHPSPSRSAPPRSRRPEPPRPTPPRPGTGHDHGLESIRSGALSWACMGDRSCPDRSTGRPYGREHARRAPRPPAPARPCSRPDPTTGRGHARCPRPPSAAGRHRGCLHAPGGRIRPPDEPPVSTIRISRW